MPEPVFFKPEVSISLLQIAQFAGVEVPEGHNPEERLNGIAPLDRATSLDLSYMDNPKYIDDYIGSSAGVLLVSKRFVTQAPKKSCLLVCNDPYQVYARVISHMYPAAIRPQSISGEKGIAAGSYVHPTAKLEVDVTVDQGAIISSYAEIGSGTIIGANAVIGSHVRIGRDCSIGSQSTVTHALIGNKVIIHPGVRIGQDGFGYAMSPKGHLKVPQIGRVIIQDHVEIGANTTIDRGSGKDTIVGEGTKIDNLVQIAHNVVIGRHCVIVAQVGISGSTRLDDYVILAGQAGLAGHLHIGMGAQVAAASGVMRDIPAGAKWGGTPAKPAQEWLRDVAYLKKISAPKIGTSKISDESTQKSD